MEPVLRTGRRTGMNRRTSAQNTVHGTIYNLNYQLHIEHLIEQLTKFIEPEFLSTVLLRVDVAVSTGKVSRVQALAREINKAAA